MKIFFYSTAPLEGYVLKQYDADGSFVCAGEAARRAIDPAIYAMMTRSAAQMSLMRLQGSFGFFVKGLESADHKKRAAMAIIGSRDEQRILCRAAAWACTGFEAFARTVLDCIHVYSDVRGYELDQDGLKALVELLGGPAEPVLSGSAAAFWKQISSNSMRMPYTVIVVKSSLDYFNRMLKLNVEAQDVQYLHTEESVKALDAGVDLTQAPVPEAKPEAEDMPKAAEEPAVCKEQQAAQEFIAPQQEQQKPKPEEKRRPDGILYTVHDDRIDLLKTKWFLPTTIGAAAAVIATAAWFILH